MTSAEKPKTVAMSRLVVKVMVINWAFAMVVVVGLVALGNVHKVSEGRMSWAGYIEGVVQFILVVEAISVVAAGIGWLAWRATNPGTRLVLAPKGGSRRSPGPDGEPGGR
jgi:hypothetical protein